MHLSFFMIQCHGARLDIRRARQYRGRNGDQLIPTAVPFRGAGEKARENSALSAFSNVKIAQRIMLSY
jgi:hypothetical protein